MTCKVVSLAPSRALQQTVADVAFMLSDGGRHPIFDKDIVALCERCDPRWVRIAMRWAVVQGELEEHPALPGAYLVGNGMIQLAQRGGFPDAA